MAKGNLSKTYQGEGPAAEALLENFNNHLNTTSGNPHKVTAHEVGAYSKGEVDEFLAEKADTQYVDDKFAELIGGAPEALDTLKEISKALEDDDNVAAELTKQIENRYTKNEIDTEFANVEAAYRALSKSKAGKNEVYTKNEVDEFLTEKATVSETDRRLYSVPSAGLEIADGVVIGIGSCRDEHIVIPEVDGSGNEVYAVADNVFGNLLDDGDFIKSITFPPSIKRFENEHGRLDSSVINGDYCANLESVYILNPNIEWIGTIPLKLPGATKNVYFGGTRKQWSELNKDRYLIQLKDENIAAGIVPTLHYSYFLPYGKTYTKEEIDNKIGSIDTALDELHAYATSLIGGEA